MKVILNSDVKHLGELGDVKNVANGYARNYLFPHMYAVPYNDDTVAYFEGRKAEIEALKAQKRADSASLKDKLEALEVKLTMPAGTNGKLYGAVTSQTISDFYAKNGFDIERKKIEIPGLTIKNTGSYQFVVHLYESTVAEVKLVVDGQVVASTDNGEKKEEKAGKGRKERAPKADKVAEEKPAEAAEGDAPKAEEPNA